MQVLQPRVLDLNAVIADMGKMLSRLIGEHIEYSFLPDPKLPPVKVDSGQISQVIMNLAVNSRDAMPGGGKLTVHTAAVMLDEVGARKRPPLAPGPYVMLSVTDTGHGMDEETKSHIFEPFFTTKELGKGTGLGLATVYGVVKQSGGYVWVESAPGKGATFEIYLPPAAGTEAAADAEVVPPAIPRGTGTILVVEDDDGVRELASKFLRAYGYSVLEARDGLEALQILQHHPGIIHLVVSDLVMPRMGGLELGVRLKAQHPQTKLLFVTGYAEYAGNGHGRDSSDAVILQKPFSSHSLVGKVREILEENPLKESGGAAVRSST
jgi:CheY-like chemotaxis protein